MDRDILSYEETPLKVCSRSSEDPVRLHEALKECYDISVVATANKAAAPNIIQNFNLSDRR